MGSSTRNSIVLRPIDLALVGKALAGTIGLIFVAQLAVILATGQNAGTASGYLSAALAAVAAACAFWRAVLLPRRDRAPWLWVALGIALWAAAHAVEARFRHSSAGTVLTVDAASFIFISAILSLLIALSATPETQSIRAVSAFHFTQIALALLLAWVLLGGSPFSAARAAAIMTTIDVAAGFLLVVIGLVRLFCWATEEEKQCFRTINILLWTYLSIDVVMDHVSRHYGIKSGTLFDLLWGVPFILSAWNALSLPLEKAEASPLPQRSRVSLLVECLYPLLLTAAIFALAAAVIPRHRPLGLAAMFVLLVVQGFQSAVVQVNYLVGHNLLHDREQKLRSANAALEQLTLLDPLTGVSNRRAFDSAYATAWRRAQRRRYALALLLVDVDSFKGVNDLHGHAYGDECLVALARVMDAEARRPDDLLARLGGEEFVLLLPDTSVDGAVHVAQRLHEAVRKLSLANHASTYDGLLTISIGIAFCMPKPEMQPAALFEAADQALYSAKEQGRNRTYSVLLRAEADEDSMEGVAEAKVAPEGKAD